MLRDLLQLTKPRLTAMNVLMTAGGVALADTSLSSSAWAGLLIGSYLLVGGANGLNMILERDLDAKMGRTQDRPLPAGRLSVGTALAFSVVITSASLPLLALYVNPLTAMIGAAAFIAYVCVYTPLKPHTSLALYVGAFPGAAPPLMGWTAATNAIEWPGVALFAVLFVWQLPHFLAIAIYLKSDYQRAGFTNTAIEKGERSAQTMAIAWAVFLVPVSTVPFFLNIAGPVYLTIALITGTWFALQGFKGRNEERPELWARRFFRASLVYLPFVVIGLVAERLLS
jgi:protoheme IX farnesyltransferase